MARLAIYSKNGAVRVSAEKWKFFDGMMNEQYVMCTIRSEKPVPFAVGDYCEFRGERYVLSYIPTAKQRARTGTVLDAYTYDDVKFCSVGDDELSACTMLDVVSTEGEWHEMLGTNYTGSATFQLFCGNTNVGGVIYPSVCVLMAKIEANLNRKYGSTGPGKWTIHVNVEEIKTEDKVLSFDNTTVTEAMAEVHNTFGLNHCIRGRHIYVGYDMDGVWGELPHYGYGKGFPSADGQTEQRGLFEIEREADSRQQIVTRLRVLGSSKNLPYRYYNEKYHLSQALFPLQLQLPDTFLPYGDASTPGTKAYNNAHSRAGIGVRAVLGDTNDAYIDKDDNAEQSAEGVREASIRFDGSDGELEDIYPTIEKVTFADLRAANVKDQDGNTGEDSFPGYDGDESIDEILVVESDANQGDGILNPEGTGVQSESFHIVIKDMGFDLTATFIDGETPVVAIKSGDCVAREFEIGDNVERWEDTSTGKKGYRLTLFRAKDDSLNTYYPNNVDGSGKLYAGAKFVLLHINMPDAYVESAELRLLRAATDWLAANSVTRFTYKPQIDGIYLQRDYDRCLADEHPENSILYRLYAGLHFTFKDIPVSEGSQVADVSITIEQLTIEMGDGLVPKVDIKLNDDIRQSVLEKITASVSTLSQSSSTGIDRLVRYLNDLFTKDTSTDPSRIRANYSLYTNGHLLGMAGVAAGGITDPSSSGGGGTTDHSELDNLGFDESGHTGFQRLIDATHKLAYSLISGTPTSLPASDVYAWAKAATKPSYTFSEITGSASTSQIPELAISKISGLQGALDGKVPVTRTVNGHALSDNVTISKGDIGLGNVENTKLSTWAGSTNLTILGTIATGVWQGTPVADTYIASAATWNAKQNKIADVADTPQDYKYVSAVSQTNGKIAVTHTDFPIATTEHIGMVSAIAQSFAGNKTFTGFVHSDADVIGQAGVAAGGITDPTSSGGGVSNYNDLDDRPLINGAVLVGGESISLQPTISNLATIIENAVAGKIASDNLGGHTVAKDVPADAKFTDTVYDDAVLAGRVTAIETKDATYDAHLVDTNNPHAVTQAQVGLGNVDNTADADKNVLSATKLTTARTLWGVSFDGSANITTAPDLYIGTTKVQVSSATQNLTGIGTLATSNKVTIGGGGLDVTGDIIAHNNIVLGDSTNNRSLYAYYLENDPIQMVGYNPDQGRIHFGYGAWAKGKAVTLEGNTIQFLSAAGTLNSMNFDASGNLGINVTTPQHRLDVGGDIFASAQIVGQTGVAAGGITDPTSSGGGGGGSVDAVKVNDVTYNPDASGVVTLPNYYNKTESDTKYATKTALQTTNIAVGVLDTRLTTDEANISGMSTDIYNLKEHFTNTGKAKDADKLDGHDSSYFAIASDLNNYYTKSESDAKYLTSASFDNYYTKSDADARYWRPDVDRLASGKLTMSGGLDMLSDITCAGQCNIGTSSDYFIRIYGGIIHASSRFVVGENNYKVWHEGNDGSGSGLDADTLDGNHASYFQPASTAINTGNIGSQLVYGVLTNNARQGGTACYDASPGLHFYRYSGDDNTIGGGDGWILQWSWNQGSVGGQIYLDDNPSKIIGIRGYIKAGEFTSWTRIALTSDIPTNNNQLTNGAGYITSSGSCAYASSAGNADTLDSEHASAFAHIGAHNNLTANGNEFTFASSGFSGGIYLNYRTAGGPNGNITDYLFCNGSGGTLVALSTLIAGASQGSAAYGWGNHASAGYAYASQLGSYLALSGGIISGNLGINVSSPYSKLHIGGESRFTNGGAGSSVITRNQCAIICGPSSRRTQAANSYYAGVGFNHMLNYDNDTRYDYTIQAWIGLRLYDTPGSERSSLVFATKEGIGDEAAIERMCISPLGNVGVGTSSPSYKLDVNGSFNCTSGYINGSQILTQSAADARYWRPDVDRLASGKLTMSGGLDMLSDITCAGQCNIGTSSDYFRYIHGNIFAVHGRIEKDGHYFRRYLGVYAQSDLPGSSVAETGDYAIAQVYTNTFVFAIYATAGGRTGWWSAGQLSAI